MNFETHKVINSFFLASNSNKSLKFPQTQKKDQKRYEKFENKTDNLSRIIVIQ